MITSTAAVVTSMVNALFAKNCRNWVISLMVRFNRLTTRPVIAVSKYRWGRCSSCSKYRVERMVRMRAAITSPQ